MTITHRAFFRQEIFAMAIGLHKQEGRVERQADKRNKGQLARAVIGPRHRNHMIGHDQHQHRHRHQYRKQRIGPRNPEAIFPMDYTTNQNGKPRDPMQHDHDRSQQRITHQGWVIIP